MHCLYAAERDLPTVETALIEAELSDVTISRPFLGRVVISCAHPASHAHLAALLDTAKERVAA